MIRVGKNLLYREVCKKFGKSENRDIRTFNLNFTLVREIGRYPAQTLSDRCCVNFSTKPYASNANYFQHSTTTVHFLASSARSAALFEKERNPTPLLYETWLASRNVRSVWPFTAKLTA